MSRQHCQHIALLVESCGLLASLPKRSTVHDKGS
jgi:hypothetical protein